MQRCADAEIFTLCQSTKSEFWPKIAELSERIKKSIYFRVALMWHRIMTVMLSKVRKKSHL